MKRYSVFFLALLLSLASGAFAQEQLERPEYVKFKPFVTNYGLGSRLHYLKVEMSVRVESLDHMQRVERHMPSLRDTLVFLFSQQTAETVNSHEGRQQLRKDALNALNIFLEEEEGGELVTDVLFDNFIVQS